MSHQLSRIIHQWLAYFNFFTAAIVVLHTVHVEYSVYIDCVLVHFLYTVCTCIHVCSPLPGNQILISKYLARRGVVVSGGWSNGSGW